MKPPFIAPALVFFILAIGQAGAIGISPGRLIINFQPGLEDTFYFTIYNGGDTETRVQLYARGEMNATAELEKNSTVLKPNSQEKFAVKIKLPLELSLPGNHELLIGAVEQAERKPGRNTMIGAVTGVESQVYILVPYPGKYASLSVDVGDVVVGEPILFTLIASNLGSEQIENATAFIDVYSPDQQKIASFPSSTELISPKETKELYAEWLPSNVSAGIYRVAATLFYDDHTAAAETNFRLGDMLIEILNITADKISNEIVRFEISMQSFWNDAIPGVYADINVSGKSGNIVATTSTPPVTVSRWSKAKLETFLKIDALEDGVYSAAVMLHYSGKMLQKQVQFEIKKGGGFKLNPIYIVVALLVLVIIYLMISKKRSVHNEEKETV